MNLINFLGWEYDNGVYRNEGNEANGELYRVVDNKLEIYDSDLLEWIEYDLLINEYSKLQSVEPVGAWREGFAIHNREEWQTVKNYYLQKGYEVSNGVLLIANNCLEDGIVFYIFLYCGHPQIIKNKQTAKKDLVLKPIDWHPKYYAKYAGKAKFGTQMYWQMGGNRNEVSLVEKDRVESWHSMGMLGTLRDWKHCGITEEDAVFIPVENK